MAELPTLELYRYRAHVTPYELYSYRRIKDDIARHGVREPVVLACDGSHVVVEDGHKRIEAAIELGIKTLPVEINRRRFSATRRVKYAIGPLLAELLTPPPKKPSPRKATARV